MINKSEPRRHAAHDQRAHVRNDRRRQHRAREEQQPLVVAHDDRPSFVANRTAENKLPGSALPCQAMSNAVPWSTLVRTTPDSPSVIFTADSNASIFTGMWP